MKRVFLLSGILCICSCFLTRVHAQFIRGNEFNLPVVGNEVAFVQLDTAKKLVQDDFYKLTKEWLDQTYEVTKFQLDDPENGRVSAEVHFKIDDQNILEPLNYTGLISIDYKDEVIRLKLHQLSYEKGAPKGKAKNRNGNFVEVTAQVKEQVRAGADKLYPHTWDSLQQYGQSLLANFKAYIDEASTQQL